MNCSRACACVLLGLLGGARPVQAGWLLTPLVGATLGTNTAHLDLDGVAGRPHTTFGVALTRFPERMVGVDIETLGTPSVFTGHDLIQSSRALTVMGSVVIALPARW